jgi:glycosyltransferase involved in cell wall biosynthesis
MARIVFVNRYFHPDVSATSQMLADVAFGLAREGHEISVICSRQLYDDPTHVLPARETVRGVTVRRLGTTRFGRAALAGRALDYLSFYASLLAQLPFVVRRGDFLVTKTDPPLLSIPCGLVARLRGARLVNWLQDVFPEVAQELGVARMPGWAMRALQQARDWSLRGAHANVVIGEQMRRYFLGRDIDACRLHVIENWSDPAIVRPLPSATSELRATLDAGDAFILGHSGNLGRAHDVDTLLAAADLLREEPFVFLIVGGGAGLASLRRGVEARGLGDRFRFLPYQPRERLADTLAAADVHLVSLQPCLEGFIVPSKIYGILAAGRPALFIGARDGAVGTLLDANGCGFTIEPGNPSQLARAARRLASDPALAAEMGRRAAELHQRRHTVDAALGRWQEIIAVAAAEPRPARAA